MTYDSAVKKFSQYTNIRLLELLLAEQKKPGWTATRAVFITALKEVSVRRGLTDSESL
jgi:hypothetical protein